MAVARGRGRAALVGLPLVSAQRPRRGEWPRRAHLGARRSASGCAPARRCSTSSWSSSSCGFRRRVEWQRLDRPIARATVAGALPDSVRLNRAKANIGPFYLDLLTGPDATVIRELLLDPRARVREYATRGGSTATSPARRRAPSPTG